LYSKIRPSLSKAVLIDFSGLCSADMYPVSSKIEPSFLLRVILSALFLNQVVQAENRVKMPKLNQEALNAFLVPTPPLPEQSRIVTKLDELFALTRTLRVRLTDARAVQARLASALVDEVAAC
jgi:type I restriction enzyme S subunit